MTKQSGLGDGLYVGGYDLSGDIGSLSRIGGGPAPLDVTAINKSAFERIGGRRDGSMEFAAYFNPGTDAAHSRLSSLPTTDTMCTYRRGSTLGNPAASLVARQVTYDGTRAADGSFTFAVSMQANGYGLEWGRLLTAGTRTDAAATNGASIDDAAGTALGLQAYLHVTEFTGTDVTIKVQHSTNDAAWADLTGAGFTQVTSGPTWERIDTSATETVNRYLRVVTTTSGGFTSLSFVVVAVRNLTAVTF